jgi:hypothetical protein
MNSYVRYLVAVPPKPSDQRAIHRPPVCPRTTDPTVTGQAPNASTVPSTPFAPHAHQCHGGQTAISRIIRTNDPIAINRRPGFFEASSRRSSGFVTSAPGTPAQSISPRVRLLLPDRIRRPRSHKRTHRGKHKQQRNKQRQSTPQPQQHHAEQRKKR